MSVCAHVRDKKCKTYFFRGKLRLGLKIGADDNRVVVDKTYQLKSKKYIS